MVVVRCSWSRGALRVLRDDPGPVAADESPVSRATLTRQNHGEHSGAHGTTVAPASAPLRQGESFVDLEMPEPYTPKAPTYGTDDYRCFLLDPGLAEQSYVTGVDVLPGHPELVHHVILFRVEPDQVAAAKAKDADAGRARAGPASAARACRTVSAISSTTPLGSVRGRPGAASD